MSVLRRVSVTAGLVGAGMLVGAAAGVGVVAPVLLFLAPLGWALLVPAAFAAAIGAGCGAVLAPLAGLTLLRAVPLGRLFAGVAVGTATAGAAALLVGLSLGGIVAVATAGFAAAALRLRWADAHPGRGVSIRPRAGRPAPPRPPANVALQLSGTRGHGSAAAWFVAGYPHRALAARS